MSRHIYNFAYVFISEKFWQSLSAEDQELISEAVHVGCDYQMEYLKNKEAELEQMLKDEGMEFIYPDRALFREAAMGAYDSELVKKLGDKGQKVITRIREIVAATK